MDEHIYPNEARFFREIAENRANGNAWIPTTLIEELKPVARAAGLHCSRVDGSPIVYNQDDTSLPDLVVCRPELAEQILDFVRQHGTE